MMGWDGMNLAWELPRNFLGSFFLWPIFSGAGYVALVF